MRLHEDPGAEGILAAADWALLVVEADPSAPGFEKIVIHPHPDARVGHARAEYDSVRGKIVSEWSLAANGALSLTVTIPANTTATVILPSKKVEIGSGTHTFN